MEFILCDCHLSSTYSEYESQCAVRTEELLWWATYSNADPAKQKCVEHILCKGCCRKLGEVLKSRKTMKIWGTYGSMAYNLSFLGKCGRKISAPGNLDPVSKLKNKWGSGG